MSGRVPFIGAGQTTAWSHQEKAGKSRNEGSPEKTKEKRDRRKEKLRNKELEKKKISKRDQGAAVLAVPFFVQCEG